MDILIWSVNKNLWYGPNRLGYTSDAAEAGRYTAEEAGDICAASNGAPWDYLVPVHVSVAPGWLEHAAKRRGQA